MGSDGIFGDNFAVLASETAREALLCLRVGRLGIQSHRRGRYGTLLGGSMKDICEGWCVCNIICYKQKILFLNSIW